VARPGYTGPSDMYLEYKDIKGWVPEDFVEQNDFVEFLSKSEAEKERAKQQSKEEPKEEEKKEEEPKEEEPKEEPKPEEKEDKKEAKEEKKSLDTMTIVLICVIVGLALALAALVTILLINAKKKKGVTPAVEDKEAEEKYEEELAEKNIALAEAYEAEEKASDVEKTAKHAKKD
jgi:hypothetical protein